MRTNRCLARGHNPTTSPGNNVQHAHFEQQVPNRITALDTRLWVSTLYGQTTPVTTWHRFQEQGLHSYRRFVFSSLEQGFKHSWKSNNSSGGCYRLLGNRTAHVMFFPPNRVTLTFFGIFIKQRSIRHEKIYHEAIHHEEEPSV